MRKLSARTKSVVFARAVEMFIFVCTAQKCDFGARALSCLQIYFFGAIRLKNRIICGKMYLFKQVV